MVGTFRRPIRSIILVSILLSFALGTSPPPPPYHQYTVDGVIERPSGGSKQGFAIVLMGFSPWVSGPDSGFLILNGVPYPRLRDYPIGITDSAGLCHIRVSFDLPLDSLRVAAIVPDEPTVHGPSFAVDVSMGTPHSETYSSEPESGCSGCGTEPHTSTRVVYYSYFLGNKTLVIPF